MKNYYTSTSELVSGEIADDFTYYFTKSEQTNSSVGLGVLVNPDTSIQSSGGYILQLMPGASEETISTLENVIANLPNMSSHYNDGNTPEDLFEILSNGSGEILKKIELKYACPCSYDGFLKSLNALSVESLTPLVEEDHGAHIQCHFCHKEYDITESDLQTLIDKKTAE
jgi:molecular chaperone Hsp33